MACSLCRLPFAPGPRSLIPSGPPPGVLDAPQYKYLCNGVGISEKISGVTMPLRNFEDNSFEVIAHPFLFLMPYIWEYHGETMCVMHTTCAALFLNRFEAEGKDIETLTNLAEINYLIGKPQGGKNSGRFPNFPYESIGEEKVDLRPYWALGSETGGNKFEWHGIANNKELSWLLSRPNLFPKFHAEVTEKRLHSIGEATCPQRSPITDLPEDVYLTLVTHLNTPSLLALTSTCRVLRRHALTALQSEARRRVSKLGWAIPLPSEIRKAKGSRLDIADISKTNADWFLYLSHVNRTSSMRVRKWIYGLADALAHSIREAKSISAYADLPGKDGEPPQTSPKRLVMKEQVEVMNQRRLQMGTMIKD